MVCVSVGGARWCQPRLSYSLANMTYSKIACCASKVWSPECSFRSSTQIFGSSSRSWVSIKYKITFSKPNFFVCTHVLRWQHPTPVERRELDSPDHRTYSLNFLSFSRFSKLGIEIWLRPNLSPLCTDWPPCRQIDANV